jgi:hypothetical protein
MRQQPRRSAYTHRATINAEIIPVTCRACVGLIPVSGGPPADAQTWSQLAPVRPAPFLTARRALPADPFDASSPLTRWGRRSRRVFGRKRKGAGISFVVIKCWTTVLPGSRRVGPACGSWTGAAARALSRQSLILYNIIFI